MDEVEQRKESISRMHSNYIYLYLEMIKSRPLTGFPGESMKMPKAFIGKAT